MLDLKHTAVFCLFFQKITVRADVDAGVGDDFLTDCVNRGIGNLSENLLEVVKQRLMLVGKHGKRNINTHGGGLFNAVFRHRQNCGFDVLIGVAERLV